MNKRKLHHRLVWLRSVPAFMFLGLAVLFGVTAVFALRNNNVKMVELRDAVYRADEQNGDVEGALRDLREHVYAHMNTDLTASGNAIRPPIQLKHTYERLVEVEQGKLQAANAGLYDEATRHCEALHGAGQIIARAQCTADYVAARGVQPVSIPEDLYKFDFVSPKWSPDLAGWSIVLAVSFSLLFIIRVGSEQLIKLELEQ